MDVAEVIKKIEKMGDEEKSLLNEQEVRLDALKASIKDDFRVIIPVVKAYFKATGKDTLKYKCFLITRTETPGYGYYPAQEFITSFIIASSIAMKMDDDKVEFLFMEGDDVHGRISPTSKGLKRVLDAYETEHVVLLNGQFAPFIKKVEEDTKRYFNRLF